MAQGGVAQDDWGLHALYALWESAGLPVPLTLGWSAEGVIGFSNLGGSPATDVVEQLGDAFLDSVDALVARYAEIASPAPARTSLAMRHDWYAQADRAAP